MRQSIWAAIAALLLWPAPGAYAFSEGIPSSVFGAAGCPLCHGGGEVPEVVLSGPTSVAAGETVEYTLTVFGSVAQHHAGLNVSAPVGALSIGGSFADGTQTVSGLLGLAEITHSEPKQADFLNVVEFSFLWTAPAGFTATTLRGWGNAVNLSDSPSGDAAALATLEVVAKAGAETPTPTPTTDPNATPTATLPPGVCADAAPSSPPLLSAALAQSCQAAIAKVGAGYVKKALKAMRKCLLDAREEDATVDPYAACVGSSASPPGDLDTAEALAEAQAKAAAVLAAKCPDAAVRALNLCDDSAGELALCLLATHRQAVADSIAGQFGAAAPGDDKGLARCQKALAKAAANQLTMQLRASQKCLIKRNKHGLSEDGAARCLGAHAGGDFVAPLEGKTATAAGGAAAKLRKSVDSACSDAQIAALGLCGSDRATAVDCLLCAQRATIFSLIANEFGP